MTTQRTCTLLALMALQLFARNTFAQQNPDTLAVLKNEIGVSLVPPILILNAGSNQQSPLAHVFYKRRLNEHLYGRLSLVLNNGSAEDQFRSYSRANVQPNPNAYVEYTYYEGRNYLQYMAGIESRWGRKQIQQFAGVDLGYTSYKSETKTRTHMLASPSGIITDSLIADYKHNNQSAIISPFYGLILGLSKHFFMTAQVGIHLQLSSRDSQKIIDIRNSSSAPGRTNNFNMDVNGVANHISVCYRF